MMKKLKEWGLGMLMLGTSAAALLGGTNEENYNITPENLHVEMMSQTNPERRAAYESGDFSKANGFADKLYYVMGKTMQAAGEKTVEQDGSNMPTVEEMAPIRKQYEMLEKAFSRSDNFHQVRENYFKIWEMSGKPALADKDNKSLTTALEVMFVGNEDRACYNSVINEIYNPKGTYDDQMAEMAHAFYQQHASQFWGVALDKLTHPLTDQMKTYNMVNLTEFNTHACVEPVLKDCVSGKIPVEHIEQEALRRIKISEKLADAGLEYMPKNQAMSLIADMSHYFAAKDGAPAFGNGNNYRGVGTVNGHSPIVGKQSGLDAAKLIDTKLLAFQLEELKAGRIQSPEEFFDGLKKMKDTLNEILGDKEMAQIATDRCVTAADVAVLAGLGRNNADIDRDMNRALAGQNAEGFKNATILASLNRMNMKEVSPVALDLYFGMRDTMPGLILKIGDTSKTATANAKTGTLKGTLRQAAADGATADAAARQNPTADKAPLSATAMKQAAGRG